MLNTARRLAANTDGNFVMLTALMAMPVVVVVGFAADYAMMSRTRAHLQGATDAAVLAVAREGALLSDAEAKAIAGKFLTAQFAGQKINYSVTRRGQKIILDAQVDAGTRFDTVMGGKDWKVSTRSTSEIMTLGFEIGLVLDTTGSMKGGKLASMKDAVNGLVDSMSAQVKEKDKLKFALIPFSTFVNVGPQHGPTFVDSKQIAGTGKSWLDLDGTTQLTQPDLAEGVSRFQIYNNLSQTWPGCVETRYASGKSYDIDDTQPSPLVPGTRFVPIFAADEPDLGYANSYVNSLALPYDQNVFQKKARWSKYGVETNLQGKPLNKGQLKKLANNKVVPITIDASTSSYWQQPKGPGVGCSSKPILPLSANFTEIKRQVDALEAAGNTNIMEGVAWGLRVLSPTEPFTEGVAYNRTNVKKVMIVLTDGTNTMGNRSGLYGSYYSSFGYLHDGRLSVSGSSNEAIADAMNERTLAACKAAKDAGMEIYTIRLEEPNVKTGTMLQECASDPSKYFDVPNRSQLDEAFKGIKDTVTTVRLAF